MKEIKHERVDMSETKYERFSDRLRKCTKDGILFEEKCPRCGQILLMCKKHGGQCRSGKCREERIN